MSNFLLNAIKYYKELPHQTAAWDLLVASLTSEQLVNFQEAYRAAPPKPKREEGALYAEHPVTQKILARILELKIELEKPPTGYRSYVVGVSGANLDLTPNNNQLDKWNDAVGVLRVWHDGKVQVIGMYRGTTDCGAHYTYNPMNQSGGANVVHNILHDRIWKIGWHRSQSNCLVQTGNEVACYRDLNKNGRSVDDKITKGFYGINLHTTGNFSWGSVGKWSAGCTVLPLTKEKNVIVNDIKKSYDWTTGGDKRVGYILLLANEL